MKIILKGFFTGILLQLAIGPVFFYLMNITIQSNLLDALLAVVAVTLADFIFIILSIGGVAHFLGKSRFKRLIGNVSASILIIFGLVMFWTAFGTISGAPVRPANAWLNCLSIFTLTLSSPLGILFWMSVFSTKAMELKLMKGQVWLFGLGAGLATPLFLGLMVLVINTIKQSIPADLARYSNAVIGIVIIVYAMYRLIVINQKKARDQAPSSQD